MVIFKNLSNTIKILFITTNQFKVKITIDPRRTMEELIKRYFEKINRPELFGDRTINFLFSGSLIPQDSQNSISEYIGEQKEITILISDTEDQITENMFI